MQLSSVFWSFSKDVQDHILYFTNEGRGKAVVSTVAIGRAIANRLSMPSGEVENIDNYFRAFLEIDTLRQVSRLNEMFLVEVQEVMEFVAKFYKLRYAVLFPRKNVYCTNSVTALQDFIGISQYRDTMLQYVLTTHWHLFFWQPQLLSWILVERVGKCQALFPKTP